ncbi:MarR family winged helix-turn-helix transcriptional regulator [Vibrio porteresiae]|uniref:MarR family transcriptional regulator n=1 Tax=Vibrio porteresiae DSM 19223 TaxID=1123496 RepID=A0ABZ0QAY8_9VIBR|nr:MarR family transcriptional regulator [Vibrio porteresiae]WPC73629.1 MarR family transcriptional regulator [Vibrio porteresiae DSM 19223]
MSLAMNLEQLERFSAKVWRKHGKEDPISHLSFNEYDYLKAIQSAGEPIRLTDLAKKMEVTKPSASSMVKRLEGRGMIRRILCHEDARSVRFELTEEAEKHLSNESKVYALMALEMTDRLTDEEAIFLDTLLHKSLS